MICSGCGNLISERLNFCEKCGTYINLGVAADKAATFRYAGFWKRFFAGILDAIIVYICVYIVGELFLPTNTIKYSDHMSNKQLAAYLSYVANSMIISTVINWLYFALLESSEMQATLGKMVLGIKVTDTEGARISFLRATARHFVKYISALILYIGFLMAAFTEKKQALHDMMTECLVISE